jgi:ankyrin repeat protein
MAAYNNESDIVQLLLDYRSPMDERQVDVDAAAEGTMDSGSGTTPLAFAAQRGLTEVVRVLLAAGASIHASDANGRTPLYLAVENKQSETTALMLGKNITSGDDRTPRAAAYEWALNSAARAMARNSSLGQCVQRIDALLTWNALLWKASETHCLLRLG